MLNDLQETKACDFTVELLRLAIRTPVKKYLTSYVAISFSERTLIHIFYEFHCIKIEIPVLSFLSFDMKILYTLKQSCKSSKTNEFPLMPPILRVV